LELFSFEPDEPASVPDEVSEDEVAVDVVDEPASSFFSFAAGLEPERLSVA
jgi:hypothetical protein